MNSTQINDYIAIVLLAIAAIIGLNRWLSSSDSNSSSTLTEEIEKPLA